MKKTRLLLLCSLLLLLAPSLTLAYSVKTDNSVYIPANETVDGNLYAAGSSLTIDGNIDGDVFCGARSLTINGKVKGDVICAAQNIVVRGQIEGSARLLGETARLEGSVGKGLQFFGTNLTLTPEATVAWDTLLGAESATIQGKVGGTLHGMLARVEIIGEISKDVKLRLDPRTITNEPLYVADSAMIGGNLFYTAGTVGNIADKAIIRGETGFSEAPKPDPKKKFLNQVWSFILSLFSALIIGLVLITIAKHPLKKAKHNILTRPGQAMLWGGLVMFLTPLACLLLLATLIGIPLALITLTLWIILLYLSKIITALALGKWFNKKYRQEKPLSENKQMILGITLLWLIIHLPFVGWLFSLFALLLGLGGLALNFEKNKEVLPKADQAMAEKK